METNAARPGDNDHLLALCHMLSNRIGMAFGRELEPCNITPVEWRVMLTLGLLGTASGREITRRWAMDKMAVSRAINGLQERGLVGRRQNKTDRRRYDLKLTARGKALYSKILPVANRRYHELLSCLEKGEAERLRHTIIKLINHIDTL